VATASRIPQLLQRVLSQPLARCSDLELLAHFTERGDEAAFGHIVDRHGPMLLGYCRRQLRDAHLAEDALQATFLVLARKASSIRRRQSLAAWLYGVARRLARQARLADAARLRRERRAADTRGQVVPGDSGWDDLLRALDEELQRLPEQYRAPLLLCFLEGRTQDEAARQLGWSLNTLRRRLESGRELLRARMTSRGATLGAGLMAGCLAPSAVRGALSPPLRQAILAVARKGADAIPSSVLALANRSGGMSTIAKLLLTLVTAGAITAVIAGVYRQEPSTGPEPGKQSRETPGAGKLADEPLPKGAVARLGSLEFRHGRAVGLMSLAFTSDGKHLVSLAGGWARRWDIATGRADINLGDGLRHGSAGSDLITADGKLARMISLKPTKERPGFAWQFTEYELQSGNKRTFPLEHAKDLGADDSYISPAFISHDGSTMATRTDKGSIILWNGSDGKIIRLLKPSSGRYTALALAADGKTIVVGDDTHTIRFFDVASGIKQRAFTLENASAVADMVLSPDGKWLATTSGKLENGGIRQKDDQLRLWNLHDGKDSRVLEFSGQEARFLLFTPDSRTLIAGTQGQGSPQSSPITVRTWEVASGKPGATWMRDAGLGVQAAVSPSGKVLVTMNYSGVIRWWDLQTGAENRPVDGSPTGLSAVCFRPDGKTLLTVGHDLAVRQWDAATQRLLGPARKVGKGHFERLWASGKILQCRSDEGRAMYDVESGKLLLENNDLPVVSQDGKRAAVLDFKDGLNIIEIPGGKVLQTLAIPPAEMRFSQLQVPMPLAFSADGRWLVLQGDFVSKWDLRTGKRQSAWSVLENKLIKKPGDGVYEQILAADLSPDGSRIALCLRKDKAKPQEEGDFARLMVLETETGKVLHQSDVEGEDFDQIAFSADGKRLAAGGHWTIGVWNVGTEKAAWRFEGHRGAVKALAFSPDGQRLVSASDDSTALIWDLPAGKGAR
jgi:RNA polymerase sigma factor (sigma-70 family)